MFQSYDSPSSQSRAPQRLRDVRDLMRKANVDAYLVARTDRNQSEYIAPWEERLAWLTGFTGSAGFAVVGLKTAAMFTDGRYTVQARAQVDTDLFELPKFGHVRPAQWIACTYAKRAAVVGFDPWLHTGREIRAMRNALSPHNITLKPLMRRNLVDAAWGKDRPAPPMGKVNVHPLKFSGAAAEKKIAAVQDQLKRDGQDVLILTLADSICWLLNIRGSDVAHNPVALCFAIVPKSGKVQLFLAPEKLDSRVRAHLKKSVRVLAPDKLRDSLQKLRAQKGSRVRVDEGSAAIWFETRLRKSQISYGADPCVALKAVKNKTEIDGAITAHVRDGAAVTRFLCWLAGAAASGRVDEIGAAQKLEHFRAETGELREISFDTISGAGPNGAIVHYRVTDATNRKLKPGELYLVDSGAQYFDGTTDITRTVAIGKPSAQMCAYFTMVLKGHIAVATARFPKGARGVDLDPFARRALWQAGLDYDHGTGHGVGSYLSVHEGPASISRAGMHVLQPGMILSNEPGYYRENHYGIRIENLVLVSEPSIPKGGERAMMSFDTITLAPIDRALVDKKLLSDEELAWINAYHARVAKEISPHLDATTRGWLKAATARI